MKKFTILKTLMLAVILLSSCGGPNPEFEQEESLRNEVFVIHDEVMPKMSDIVRLKGGLMEMKTDTTIDAEVKATMSQLEKAEDAMMGWMNNFTGPEKLRESKSHEEIMAYLQNEKLEITKVRDAMNNSIGTAERILSGVKQ
ncbi:MAG: hypothetical protein K9J37_01100 [Saprospiraceae bacterium]|nr:hypothetical protein [Saprospiraceae bacterium]MCF8248473.1 hypothetical protein [Saprospiraceae bacterium]MCF8281805.1 hypothetical protein [Bacteroidales bacterium]MCF8310207.1 hypothetical protein [Saprospiraceae bacterium]MCF8439354.1 hypothetical protein [Saprospiraceae bacterium]